MRTASISLKPRTTLRLRLQAIQVISLPEPELARLVNRVETDPLFERIKGFIRRLPSRGNCVYVSLDDIGRREPGSEQDIAWPEHEREIQLIRRMGRDCFEKYFLYGSAQFSNEEIAQASGVSVEEARLIQAFLLVLSLQTHDLPLIPQESVLRRFSCIGKIEIFDGAPSFHSMLPHLASGRYSVNYSALREFRENLTAQEKARLRKLLANVEAINLRQDILSRTVEVLLNRQSSYIVSGRKADLYLFTASDLAKTLGVYPSTIGRIVEGRSVVMPWQEEIPLHSLLANKRKVAISALEELLARDAQEKRFDSLLGDDLLRIYGISASRRAVNDYKREIMGNKAHRS